MYMYISIHTYEHVLLYTWCPGIFKDCPNVPINVTLRHTHLLNNARLIVKNIKTIDV